MVSTHDLGHWGGSRNYRIRGGGGPSLTDVLVVFYLLYRVFQLTIPTELKFQMRKWEVKVLDAVGVRVGVGCGGGGGGLYTYSSRNLQPL